MIANKVVARAPQYPYQSPIFIVPKATKVQYRLVQENRKLNELIPDEKMQSTSIRHVIREIQSSGAKYFSVLDISASFCVHPVQR